MDVNTIIKLISGITNFNTKRTLEIIEAGELGGASYIDIAADVVRFVLANL